jgi:amidase/aspartyl-tRNA(Asn)/glutamyl-tRNA(Gln) amidotransferase subunit A
MTVQGNATPPSDLCAVSSAELAKGYARHDFSPLEVMQAVLKRTETLNPLINAFFYIDAEGALAAARQSTERWGRGAPQGPLDGIPVSIKDSIAVAGTPMYRGAAPFRSRGPSTSNAPPAARLLESGAILFAKTTMPDLGMLAAGVSSAHGVTRNPWNLAYNTGGSSSGGAAALVARLGPLTVGSDLGGSVRLPAALCGLTALKPTQGRIPHLPPSPYRSAGPMARSMEDLALLFDVLSQPDGRDYGSLSAPDPRDQVPAKPDVRGWRIGILDSMGFGPRAEEPILRAVRRTAEILTQAGADVRDIGPLVDFDPTAAFHAIFGPRAFHEVAHLRPDERLKIHPALHDLIESGARVDVETLLKAGDDLDRAKASVIERTMAYDLVIAPATPVVGYPADKAAPNEQRLLDITTYTAMFNQTGQPAAVICGGFADNGLPVGVQFVGRRHEDARVLRAATLCEATLALPFVWPM